MGISSHSVARTLYLFSVFTSNKQPEGNEEIHLLVSEYLHNAGINFKEVEGRYQGEHERGFLVDSSAITEDAVQMLCKNFGQKEYIVLEATKHGCYKAVFTDVNSGQREFKGYMRSMNKSEIDRMNLDYTYRPDVGMYWTIWSTLTTKIDDFEQEKAAFIAAMPKPGLFFPVNSHALVP